ARYSTVFLSVLVLSLIWISVMTWPIPARVSVMAPGVLPTLMVEPTGGVGAGAGLVSGLGGGVGGAGGGVAGLGGGAVSFAGGGVAASDGGVPASGPSTGLR